MAGKEGSSDSGDPEYHRAFAALEELGLSDLRVLFKEKHFRDNTLSFIRSEEELKLILEEELGLPFGQRFEFSRLWFENYHGKEGNQRKKESKEELTIQETQKEENRSRAVLSRAVTEVLGPKDDQNKKEKDGQDATLHTAHSQEEILISSDGRNNARKENLKESAQDQNIELVGSQSDEVEKTELDQPKALKRGSNLELDLALPVLDIGSGDDVELDLAFPVLDIGSGDDVGCFSDDKTLNGGSPSVDLRISTEENVPRSVKTNEENKHRNQEETRKIEKGNNETSQKDREIPERGEENTQQSSSNDKTENKNKAKKGAESNIQTGEEKKESPNFSEGDDDGNVTEFLKSADDLRISTEENLARSGKINEENKHRNQEETRKIEKGNNETSQKDREMPLKGEEDTQQSNADNKTKRKENKKASKGAESSVQTGEDKKERPSFPEGAASVAADLRVTATSNCHRLAEAVMHPEKSLTEKFDRSRVDPSANGKDKAGKSESDLHDIRGRVESTKTELEWAKTGEVTSKLMDQRAEEGESKVLNQPFSTESKPKKNKKNKPTKETEESAQNISWGHDELKEGSSSSEGQAHAAVSYLGEQGEAIPLSREALVPSSEKTPRRPYQVNTASDTGSLALQNAHQTLNKVCQSKGTHHTVSIQKNKGEHPMDVVKCLPTQYQKATEQGDTQQSSDVSTKSNQDYLERSQAPLAKKKENLLQDYTHIAGETHSKCVVDSEPVTLHFSVNGEGKSRNMQQDNAQETDVTFPEELVNIEAIDSHVEEFPAYLQNVTLIHDSRPTEESVNTLRIAVGCENLEILEQLWRDYRSGHLNVVAEKCLVTDDIKRRFYLESVKLRTTVLQEDYKACKDFLLNNSQYNQSLAEREVTSSTPLWHHGSKE